MYISGVEESHINLTHLADPNPPTADPVTPRSWASAPRSTWEHLPLLQGKDVL